MIAKVPDSILIGSGLQSANARKLVLRFDQAEAQFPSNRIEKQYTDIQPLVADQIRRVSRHMKCDRSGVK